MIEVSLLNFSTREEKVIKLNELPDVIEMICPETANINYFQRCKSINCSGRPTFVYVTYKPSEPAVYKY